MPRPSLHETAAFAKLQSLVASAPDLRQPETLNAGRIADGEATVEEMGWDMFRKLLAVASGEKTWAERWRLSNDLVLFNPAPIT